MVHLAQNCVTSFHADLQNVLLEGYEVSRPVMSDTTISNFACGYFNTGTGFDVFLKKENACRHDAMVQ